MHNTAKRENFQVFVDKIKVGLFCLIHPTKSTNVGWIKVLGGVCPGKVRGRIHIYTSVYY